MNMMERKKTKNIYKRNFALGLIILLIIAATVTGNTYAWFTDTTNISNIFTAGTVNINIVEEGEEYYDQSNDNTNSYDSSTDKINPGGHFKKQFSIENTGSKSIYLRAYFEGYWELIEHKNTATVIANLQNGNSVVSDSDTAHFYYNNPAPQPYAWDGTSIGFTSHDDSIPPTTIVFGGLDNNGNGNGDNGNGSDNDTCDPGDFNTWPEEKLPDSGRGVEPITETEADIKGYPYFENTITGQNPNPDDLPKPEGCNLVRGLKYDIEDGFESGDLIAGDHGFQVSIYEFEYEGKKYYAFNSNYPIYHLYAKGGNDGGNLYRYYYPEEDPLFDEGVNSDCWLSQPGGGVSHLSFYYCEEQPDISIKKDVSVDGGSTWEDAETSPGPELQNGYVPKFKLVVENTGGNTLENVVVEDDVLDLDLDPDNPDSTVWDIGTLEPGETVEHIIENTHWWEEQLNTDNVNVKLCNSDDSDINYDKWVPKGVQKLPVYFYHTEVIDSPNEVGLCVKIYLEDDNDDKYKGATLVINSYFEAVQASNNMIEHNWGDDLEDLPEHEQNWW